MTIELQQFGTFLREQTDSRVDALVTRMSQLGPHYAATPLAELQSTVRQSLHIIANSLIQDDTTELIAYCQTLSERRSTSSFALRETLGAIDLFRDTILDCLDLFLQERTPWSLRMIRRLEDVLRLFGNHFVSGFDLVLDQAMAELTIQAEQLDAQRRTIRELSTPILPVHDGVIVLPLVGAIDSHRANQIMENLLQAITGYQADIVIVDITGVPIVDTGVVHHILQTARAARLVGARVVLVGISPEIAQTIVQLGVDLSDIPTLANLQESIEYALNRTRI